MTHFGHLDPALLNGRLIHPLLLNCGCAKVNKFPVTQKSSHMRTTVLGKPAAFLILVPITMSFAFITHLQLLMGIPMGVPTTTISTLHRQKSLCLR